MTTPSDIQVLEQLLTEIRDIQVAQRQQLADLFALQQEHFARATSQTDRAQELIARTEKAQDRAEKIEREWRKGLLVVAAPLIGIAILVLFVSAWLN